MSPDTREHDGGDRDEREAGAVERTELAMCHALLERAPDQFLVLLVDLVEVEARELGVAIGLGEQQLGQARQARNGGPLPAEPQQLLEQVAGTALMPVDGLVRL